MKLDWMTVLLGIGLILMIISIYRAHKDPNFTFNAFDLIMVSGRVDRVSLAFMLVLAVTTWLMLDLQLHEKMTEGYLTSYGAMWVIPLVSKVVFNKSDGQNTTQYQPLPLPPTIIQQGNFPTGSYYPPQYIAPVYQQQGQQPGGQPPQTPPNGQ